MKTIEEWIKDNREQMVKDIVSLVNIKSVKGESEGIYPFGQGVGKALERALSIAETAGFPTRNDHYYYGLALLQGTGSEKLGIFTHLDVVPEGNGWEFEPYRAVEKEGYLIGRGTGDNKGPAIAALYAMKYLKENDIRLTKTVELYFGCAEEKGMEDIAYYAKRNSLPRFSFTPDVAFPVSYAEKGILELQAETELTSKVLRSFAGGEVSNMVAPEAKAELSITKEEAARCFDGVSGITWQEADGRIGVKAVGIGKHAAFPEGSENAVRILCKALLNVPSLEQDVRAKLRFLSDSLKDYYGESLGIPYEDAATGKLMHTCGKAKLTEGRLQVDFNIRYPVETPADEMKARIRDGFAQAGYEIRSLTDNPPMFVSPNRQEVQELTRICNLSLGTDLKPYAMGGGTYARKIPNTVGYGPGRSDDPVRWGNGHEPDECVRIADLLRAVKIYAEALIRLDQIT